MSDGPFPSPQQIDRIGNYFAFLITSGRSLLRATLPVSEYYAEINHVSTDRAGGRDAEALHGRLQSCF